MGILSLIYSKEISHNYVTNQFALFFQVSEDIESIFLDTSNSSYDVKRDAFKNMFNLRFLKIHNSFSEYGHGLNFPNGLDSLPCGLRLLHWENYPLKSLPQDFELDNLVELCMPYSKLQTLGAGTKVGAKYDVYF